MDKALIMNANRSYFGQARIKYAEEMGVRTKTKNCAKNLNGDKK